MGETFGDYLRRRRVEVAVMRLAAQPRSKILNIALSVDFGSAEADRFKRVGLITLGGLCDIFAIAAPTVSYFSDGTPVR